ncbi:hypothetical protein ACFWBX_33755 [Streptomyces sp. NPDC059991]|uniref:hypothetical protein n=1 Tax=Streptomyces sp. NPDC059991 TaxID=3347028 RepID=UPI0036A7EDC2
MATDDGQGKRRGGISIGSVVGAMAIGDHNTVTNQQGGAPADPVQAELLEALRELRTDLDRVVAGGRIRALDGAAADAEAEIAAAGAASPGRLARLRQALADAEGLTGVLASAAAVGRTVATLLGG